MTALAWRFAFCPSRPFPSLSYVSRRFGVEHCVQRGVQRGAAYIIPLCTAFGVHFFSCTFFFSLRVYSVYVDVVVRWKWTGPRIGSDVVILAMDGEEQQQRNGSDMQLLAVAI
jgi:hypothetical protein